MRFSCVYDGNINCNDKKIDDHNNTMDSSKMPYSLVNPLLVNFDLKECDISTYSLIILFLIKDGEVCEIVSYKIY